MADSDLRSETRIAPGAEIAGYRLEGVLGKGGMGVVWLARQIALDRPVALKVLSSELAENLEFRRRFTRECKLAARLRHPHVVIVHDAREEHGVLVLAMDLVVGTDLAHLIEAQGRLAASRAVGLIEQVAGALDAAHALGLVHRDVKPANVLIAGHGDDEHAYLADFGLTKALSEAGAEGMTMPGMLLGTPAYMAPEQVRGEHVDTRADVYALGCVLFEVLAGRLPYVHDDAFAMLFAHVHDPVPSLREAAPGLPAAMDDVLTRALAKAPEARFSSAGDLARAARAAIEGDPEPRVYRTVASVDTDWEAHAVVAGLGESGSRLAFGLHDAGYRVVVIEADAGNGRITGCRERGISVLVGDAADPELLRQARIAYARHLIMTCGDDGRNLNVAMVVERELESGRPGVLTAFVHLTDLRLLRTLTIETLRGPGPTGLRLEFFNAHATGARMLLERHPALEDDNGSPVPAPRVCVVGYGPVAANLVVFVAAEWRLARPAVGRLPMMVVGPGATEHVEGLISRHPQLADICTLDVREADIHSARFQTGDVLLDADGQCKVTKVYIAVESETEAFAAALGLHGQPATRTVPIIVALLDDLGGVASALRDGGRSFVQNIEPFGVLSSALTPTLLMRGVNELLARANHQTYVRKQRADGVKHGISIGPWEELPESLKNSNRRFADSVDAALETIGYTLVSVPLIDHDRSPARFSDDEVEQLAKREHDRWMADLIRDGWRLTVAEKDPERKLHPLLVPWAQLSEAERDKDREAVRAIPQILTHAGFAVIRPGAGAKH